MILGVALYVIARRPAGEPRGVDLLPARRARASACWRRSSPCFFVRGTRGRGPDEHPQPRLLGHDDPLRRRPAHRDLRDDDTGRDAPTASRRGSGSSSAGLVGLATSVAFVYITQYYTAGTWRPVQEIAEASKTGPATNIISGTAVGFETTAVTALTIGSRCSPATGSGTQARPRRPRTAGDVGGIFGTAVATMGMLMTAAYILAMDTFGPITDNAGGIAEFCQRRRPAPARSPTASTRSATPPRR